ncbi:MAG: helix-turn-helix transcriptional regulator [Synechococcales bacterium]|nr:helix-turn-helix transcriptional regulator [Synechococcales bacterium]
MKANVVVASNLFLLSVLEGLVDGILILRSTGDVVYANTIAQEICQRLFQTTDLQTADFQATPGAVVSPEPARLDPPYVLPAEIWTICETLVQYEDLWCDRPFVLESDLTLVATQYLPQQHYRVRVQWLRMDDDAERCLMVRLEDQQQSWQSLAIAEVQKYGLTPREAEVWQLRRSNHSRKEIAAELHITLDTVKKHLCNIQLKRQRMPVSLA